MERVERSPDWFLGLLSIVYLIAFLSFFVQIDGLIGEGGILPLPSFLEGVKHHFGWSGYWRYPTLAWIHPSALFLKITCAVGALSSLLLLIRIRLLLSATLCWLLYLSVTVAGQHFFSFQWDILLLETGLLTLLWIRWRNGYPLLLLRWLLFRLMFFSGLVKLLSGDPVWQDLTALAFHYETQPLPTILGYYAHHLPLWFHQFSCLLMFAIELVVPFLIFGGNTLRRIAFWFFVPFQLLITLTGNYTFFNLLTIALCLTLIVPYRNDPDRTGEPAPETEGINRPPRKRLFQMIVCSLLFILSLAVSTSRLVPIEWPRPIREILRMNSSFHFVNTYGLFAVMTRPRYEIVIEGSEEGETWREYQFRWKPGDLGRPPGWVQPHQPRLDWQMWFAAFGARSELPWFHQMMVRILEDSPAVVALFDENPFPEKPPRFIRAQIYHYRFAEPDLKGIWWQRELVGPYYPKTSLDDLTGRKL